MLYSSGLTVFDWFSTWQVETVGDCYVAVCGLPDVRHDHAVVMARFSFSCAARLHGLVRMLEEALGPDTGR